MFLDPEQIKELTGKRQRAAQVRMLRAMGITHRLRGDGTPIVLTSHIEKLLDGDILTEKHRREPNWNNL